MVALIPAHHPLSLYERVLMRFARGKKTVDWFAPDAPEEWVVFNGMGGYICSVCGTPVESEPCEEHQPHAYRSVVS